MTNEELAAWIDDEGGVEGLIRHGDNGERMEDPETQRLWNEAVFIFENEYEPARDRLTKHIGY